MTFVCVICGHVGWRRDGRPVNDDKYPSWRCADEKTCGARVLGRADYQPRHASG